jgi:Tfp pilus assembly protein PilE
MIRPLLVENLAENLGILIIDTDFTNKNNQPIRNMLFRVNRLKNQISGFTWVELVVVIFIVGLLTAIALPSFLNQAYKDGPSWSTGRFIGWSTNQQVEYFQANGVFSEDIFKSNSISPSIENLNYRYEVHRLPDQVLHYAIAQQPKAELREHLGPFSWTKEIEQKLHSYVAIVIVRRSSDKSFPDRLEIINCRVIEAGNVEIPHPIEKGGVLTCNQGTEKAGSRVYILKNKQK